MNPISIRLLNQQLIAPQFSNSAELVSYMGAMQAQEYRMMRWAVEMRTRKPSNPSLPTMAQFVVTGHPSRMNVIHHSLKNCITQKMS